MTDIIRLRGTFGGDTGIRALVVWLAMLLAWVGCSPAPATHVVGMSGTRFTPTVDTLAVGDTVRWTNDDLFAHTVTASDSTFDSGHLDAGRDWQLVPRASGTYAYLCLYHPSMRGTLVVQDRR